MKKLTIGSLCLLLCSCLFVSLQAQDHKRLQKGRVKTLDGIILNGWIQQTSNIQLAHQVKFTSDPKAKPVPYPAKTLAGYEIEGLKRVFIQGNIPVLTQDSSRTETDSLKTVFLECLVLTDKYALYYYQSKEGRRRFFVDSEDLGFVELILDISLTEKYYNYYRLIEIRIAFPYVDVLKIILRNCTEMENDDYEQVALNLERLSGIFIAHARCVGLDIHHQAPICTDIGKTYLLGSAGVNFSNVQVADNPPQDIQRLFEGHEGFISPTFEIQLNHYPTALRNTFFIGVGLGYHLMAATSTAYNTRIRQQYLHGSALAGYQYPFGIVRPYLGVKVTAGFLLNPTTAYQTDYRQNYAFYKSNETGASAFEVGLGAFAGVDIALGRHGLRLGATYLHGLLPNLDFGIWYNNQAILLEAQFRFRIDKGFKKYAPIFKNNTLERF